MTTNDTDEAPEGGPLPLNSKNVYDPDTHQIIGTSATPEELSEQGRALQAKRQERSAARVEAEANELLEAVGFDDPSQADAAFRAIARKAPGNVAAMKLLLSQAGKLVRAARQDHAQAGQWSGSGECPTCGANHATLGMGPDALIQFGEGCMELGRRAQAAGSIEKIPGKVVSLPVPRLGGHV